MGFSKSQSAVGAILVNQLASISIDHACAFNGNDPPGVYVHHRNVEGCTEGDDPACNVVGPGWHGFDCSSERVPVCSAATGSGTGRSISSASGAASTF